MQTFSTLTHKIAFSTLVQYAGKIIQMGLGIITLKLISNFLSQSDYGLYGKITEYALFFSVAANLGIFANVVRKMTDQPKSGQVFFNALLLRLITAVLFFMMGLAFVALNHGDNVFLISTFIFLGALLFDYITSVCDGALQANYLMGRATAALIIGRIFSVGLTVLLIKKILPPEITQSTIVYLFLPTLLGSLITAILSLYFVKRKIEFKFSFDRKFMWEILKISLPFGLINILNSLYFRFLPDYFVSLGTLSNAEFATFNVSFRVAQVLSLLSTFLMFSVLPGLKHHINQKNWRAARALYKKSAGLLFLSGFMLVVIGSLLGPFMIELLTHKKYFLPDFWFAFPLMLTLAAISYGYDLVLITLFALEEDRWFLKRECAALVCASLFFISSTFISSVHVKLVFILGGALAGESLMVLWGTLKARQRLMFAAQTTPSLNSAAARSEYHNYTVATETIPVDQNG